MSRVYGDSTPFPYDIDYIDLLKQAIDCSVQLLSAQQSINVAAERFQNLERTQQSGRNQLVNIWSTRLRPDLERARTDGLLNLAREWRRRRVNPSSHEQVGHRQLKIIRTYLARLTAYKPQPYPGPVVLLRAAHTDVEEARRWRAIATGRFDMHDIPGDHFSHLREYAKATATALESCLAAGEPAGSRG